MRWENRSASAQSQESRCSEIALPSDAPILDVHAQQVQNPAAPEHMQHTAERCFQENPTGITGGLKGCCHRCKEKLPRDLKKLRRKCCQHPSCRRTAAGSPRFCDRASQQIPTSFPEMMVKKKSGSFRAFYLSTFY